MHSLHCLHCSPLQTRARPFAPPRHTRLLTHIHGVKTSQNSGKSAQSAARAALIVAYATPTSLTNTWYICTRTLERDETERDIYMTNGIRVIGHSPSGGAEHGHGRHIHPCVGLAEPDAAPTIRDKTTTKRTYEKVPLLCYAAVLSCVTSPVLSVMSLPATHHPACALLLSASVSMCRVLCASASASAHSSNGARDASIGDGLGSSATRCQPLQTHKTTHRTHTHILAAHVVLPPSHS